MSALWPDRADVEGQVLSRIHDAMRVSSHRFLRKFATLCQRQTRVPTQCPHPSKTDLDDRNSCTTWHFQSTGDQKRTKPLSSAGCCAQVLDMIAARPASVRPAGLR